MRYIYIFCRYFVALVIITYGFAKINEAQFTVLDSELDKPMREVDGFWLVWYFFGYSAFYGNFIALVQILCGIGLMIRRTTLLSACILFGMIGNIVLIDIFFRISPAALATAFFLEIMLGIILWQHRKALISVFWQTQHALHQQQKGDILTTIFKNSVRLGVLILPALITYYIANFNNRYPTPIDGRWDVEAVVVNEADVEMPNRMYFEHNRAFQSVFRYQNRWTRHHFEVIDDTVMIWDEWLKKGHMLYSATFDRQGEWMTLDGKWKGMPVVLRLRKLD